LLVLADDDDDDDDAGDEPSTFQLGDLRTSIVQRKDDYKLRPKRLIEPSLNRVYIWIMETITWR
jgi:hypothetical protein